MRQTRFVHATSLVECNAKASDALQPALTADLDALFFDEMTHYASHRRRVEAAAQVHANGDVSAQAQTYRVKQASADLIDQFLLCANFGHRLLTKLDLIGLYDDSAINCY